LKGQLRRNLILDATVSNDPANLRQIKTESGTSAAEEAAEIIGTSDVFAAFQTISHRVLRHPDMVHDVLVAGGAARKAEVMELIRSMALRPIDAGPLWGAGHLERRTVLLLSIHKSNKGKERGIQIKGISLQTHLCCS